MEKCSYHYGGVGESNFVESLHIALVMLEEDHTSSPVCGPTNISVL